MVIASGTKLGSLYLLFVSPKNSVLFVTELPNVALWHIWLGHMSRKGMETLSRSGYLPPVCFDDFPFYEHCMYGKQTCTLGNITFEKDRQPLELVHSDICSPMPTRSLGGTSYFVTFIDNETRKVWVCYEVKR